MHGWRVAASLVALRDQVNEAWPGRSRASDGTIGDAAHQSRTSDHNPWIRDGAIGVVSALDITHDPAAGCDCERIAEGIRASRDERVKYLIWNRRICSAAAVDSALPWAWRPYSGANPHARHLHVSVQPAKALYDSGAPWALAVASAPSDPASPLLAHRPVLRRGATGAAVRELQVLLNRHGVGLVEDGDFGARTEAAVRRFQSQRRLVEDGIVGARSWAALLVTHHAAAA